MPLVDSKLCIEKCNEIELAKGGCYVYAWCCANWGDIYYYVGKGHGDRYKSIGSRGKSFMAIYNNWDVYPIILQGGLTEDEALELEDYYKTHLIFDRGYPIMDGEGNHSALKNRAIIMRKKELKETKPNWKDGRPRIDLPEFKNLLKKQKDGTMTVKECCNELGISRRTWYNRVSEVC